MGFLDNSGDIIVDAVLTDHGRHILARGDGSFSIAKFALADDEINYELYRNSNHQLGAHPSGSAYYDLNILQTPVLEAFTDNIASMKSKLVSIPRTDLLYLGILKLNEAAPTTARNTTANQAKDFFVIGVDDTTNKNETAASPNKGLFANNNGFMNGTTGDGTIIRIDQGLDADLPPSQGLDPGQRESAYIIQIDNRIGSILPPGATSTSAVAPAAYSFLDDDNIAHYVFEEGTAFVINNSEEGLLSATNEVIEGPRGTTLKFKVRASNQLRDSTQDELFQKLGTLSASWVRSSTAGGATATVHYIDTVIRIAGRDTGYRIDIPVRFIKLKSG